MCCGKKNHGVAPLPRIRASLNGPFGGSFEEFFGTKEGVADERWSSLVLRS
jgi:hypothetical protein